MVSLSILVSTIEIKMNETVCVILIRAVEMACDFIKDEEGKWWLTQVTLYLINVS
jgi:hypothetical protein